MPRLVQTNWFYKYLDEEYSDEESASRKYADGIWRMRRWSIKSESLTVALEELREYCNNRNLEIKSIIPLTRAQSFEFAHASTWVSSLSPSAWGYGLGNGWGITMINGFAALLQSVEDLTEEEYVDRIAEKKKNKELEVRNIEIKEMIQVLNKEFADLNDNLSEINKNIPLSSNLSASEIQMKKGIFGVKFLVSGFEFKTEDEARQFKDKCANDQGSLESAAETIEKQIEIVKGKIQALQDEMNKNNEILLLAPQYNN